MNPSKRLLVLSLEFLLLQICISTDTIYFNESIKDDGNVLVSGGGTFTLGFFSPLNSSHRYIGIWYTKVSVQTVVWVAKGDSPINGTSREFFINGRGNLALYDNNSSRTVCSTNVSVSSTSNSTAQLLDSGNFVLVQQDNKSVLWQRIDHPTNTMLPFTELGVDRNTGVNRFLTSWKSLNYPGTRVWSFYLEPNGLPERLLYNGKVRRWRSGPWNDLRWNGIPELTCSFIISPSLTFNNDETIYTYGIVNSSIISMLFLDQTGQVKRATWQDQDRRWIEFWPAPAQTCEYHGHCEANGNCDPYNAGTFECKCLPGFEPKLPNDWSFRDASCRCLRKQGASTCRNNEGFVKIVNVLEYGQHMNRPDMAKISLEVESQGVPDLDRNRTDEDQQLEPMEQ